MDNLFGPLYEEYYATSPSEVSDFAANTLENDDTSSSSLIVVEEDEAPKIVSSSVEQVSSEPNTPFLNDNADELVQEDVAELDRNVLYKSHFQNTSWCNDDCNSTSEAFKFLGDSYSIVCSIKNDMYNNVNCGSCVRIICLHAATQVHLDEDASC
ncbi:hypothetical protein Tco_0425413 [Tanacetum coccineum]